MKAKILIFFFLTMAIKSFAGLNLKLDLEARLQAKITSLVAPLDPQAQVYVTATLKKITAELPGTGITVSASASAFQATELTFDDISAVDVVVLSKFEKFPEVSASWIKKAAELPNVKSTVRFQKKDILEADVKDPMSYDQKYLDQLAIYFQMVRTHQTIFYFICAAMSLLFLGSILFVSRIYLNGVKRIEQAMQQSSDVGGRSAPQIMDVQPLRPQIAESASVNNSDRIFIQSLSEESIAGLLSDCYWCEDDQYAIWLWLSMSPQQRTQVSLTWSYSHTYVKSLTGEGTAKKYHNHPYYLKPLKLWNVSQDDVAKWLKVYPSAWSLLSPIRQEKLDLPLMEKLSFMSMKTTGVVPKLPSETEVSRTLLSSFSITEVSEADELQIFKSYKSIPENLRAQIFSLVWLALLPTNDRDDILSLMSAQQIAQAWIGPAEVLAVLESSIGEKKLKLVQDYITKTKPDRKSVSMQYLTQEALKRFSSVIEPEESGSHAA